MLWSGLDTPSRVSVTVMESGDAWRSMPMDWRSAGTAALATRPLPLVVLHELVVVPTEHS
jgi:hypothetical protein